MKHKRYLIVIIFLVLYLIIALTITGCKTTKYVPVDRVKTEYINKIERDTVLLNNTKIIREKGDSVYITDTKYIYKTKHVRDTVLRIDTIPIIKEVEIIKEVNKLKEWQIVLMILGGGMIAIVGFKIFKIIRI